MPFPVLPAALPGILVALKTWADSQIAAGGALVALAAGPYTTIWANQDAPYPGFPYAVLSITVPPGSVGGKPDRALINNHDASPDVSRRELDYEFTFRIELYSRAPLDPLSGLDETTMLASALQASMWGTAQLDAFVAAGIGLISQTDPFTVPHIAGFGTERRAYFDTVFRARMRVDVSGVSTLEQTSAPIGTTVDPDETIHGTIG